MRNSARRHLASLNGVRIRVPLGVSLLCCLKLLLLRGQALVTAEYYSQIIQVARYSKRFASVRQVDHKLWVCAPRSLPGSNVQRLVEYKTAWNQTVNREGGPVRLRLAPASRPNAQSLMNLHEFKAAAESC